jgi:nucleotide-binding universal stress UspA family protein
MGTEAKSTSGTPKTRYLTLDNLTANLRLARRLSPGVSCRYRALPVGEDNGRITVVMADPDDEAAREAVAAALGAPLYLVAGDSDSIDAALAEVWPEVLRPAPHLLIYPYGRLIAAKASVFAQALALLLDARVNCSSPGIQRHACGDGWIHDAVRGHYDLIIWLEPEPPVERRLLSGSVYCEIREGIPTSLLVARQPRWPLRRLLLLIQDEERNNPAVDWVVRLARPSAASVTVLTVVPPVPALYGHRLCTQHGLDALLTTNTTLGRQMRRVTQWLVDWEVESTLRLRQGMPDQEIRHEVAQGDYDLIALADQPGEWWQRYLVRDWVASLLSWADRPVLIAKSITTQKRL